MPFWWASSSFFCNFSRYAFSSFLTEPEDLSLRSFMIESSCDFIEVSVEDNEAFASEISSWVSLVVSFFETLDSVLIRSEIVGICPLASGPWLLTITTSSTIADTIAAPINPKTANRLTVRSSSGAIRLR